jgi:predicted RNA-binding Zn-ribbon protein involved in translation (DUF1610 family)
MNITDERPDDEKDGAEAIAAVSQAVGRPRVHVNCGLEVTREGEAGFRCPDHGVVSWTETRYGAGK